MTKTKLIIVLAFIIALAAGGAVGVVTDRALRHRRRGSWLGQKLDLTQEQKDMMHEIWSEALGKTAREMATKRGDVHEERQEKIRDLLTDEQMEEYKKIMEEYRQDLRGLQSTRHEIFEAAREKTREILTLEQQKKYDKLLEERPGPGMRPGRPGRRGPQRPPFPRPGRAED